MNRLLVFLFALLAFAGEAAYVDNVRGDDANPGTAESPFKTIAKAMSVLKGGEELHLVSNAVPYREGVRIEARHAGTEGRPTVIDGHGALLDGLRVPADDTWKDEGDGVFSRHFDNNAWVMDPDGCWSGDFPICYFGDEPGFNVKGRADLTVRGRYFLLKKKADDALHNTLYVRLGPGETPERAHVGVLSGWENCCLVRTANVTVRNLRVTRQSWDCFSMNYVTNCLLENVDGSQAMDQGISSHSSVGVVVRKSRFHHNAGCGICDVNVPHHTYCRTTYEDCLVDANVYRSPVELYGGLDGDPRDIPSSRGDYTFVRCRIVGNDLRRLNGQAIHHDSRARVKLVDCEIEGTVNGRRPDSAAVTNVVSGTCVGDVTLVCPSSGTWRVTMTREAGQAPETDELVIRLESDVEASPPRFTVGFSVPQEDIHFIWHAGAEDLRLPPKWHSGQVSTLASGMPLLTLMNANDGNRLSFAASESVLPVRCRAGLKEEDCTVPCALAFFEQPVAPVRAYSVRIRLDRRSRRWDRTVEELTDWIGKAGGYRAMRVPEAARDPLYSTWYAFTQDVTAEKIEDEARRAARLGMKTLILDDGWQTDEKGRAYERCGDLTVSSAKFPDGMAAHVKRVQACGIKYMAWFAVPFVGYRNAAFPRFRGKFLKDQPTVHCSVLDPRFPEVRAYLVDMFARAQKEWGLDGFKFDYIGQFTFETDKETGEEIDPARAENYAGRDYRSLPDAVDALMAEILARLAEVNPDVLIEYRQPYVSPGIRRYGNMIRAIDCPGEMQKNLVRTAMLRLTSGETAVHSDMLEWNVADTPERAAKPILASLFSTIQYSMVLSRLPASHLEMMRHWIGFTQRHRETLLKGTLTAFHPEAHYPVLAAESASERVIGAYVSGSVVSVADRKPTVVVNATGGGDLVLDFAEAPSGVTVRDTFGNIVAQPALGLGLVRLSVPVSGYVEIDRPPTALPTAGGR